jgi:hypothetical protein
MDGYGCEQDSLEITFFDDGDLCSQMFSSYVRRCYQYSPQYKAVLLETALSEEQDDEAFRFT